ncbi:SDR family NAD(P)-dependent oxidoreductase [Thauera mechernichensis]|uniref:SDR family NAD(P)-dependent oxidoreductase n=1 Tax=Thauera mechernichensis TaxID=82788 RepID=A0ABW3WBV8_9RHOO|nr:SDR family NAD(P)-dependent oxidoreductase [Thauera mechernichensis]MDG3065877.1 SDR family NAD(P)-dependent oxidoreductase [Thauera mechernichensis]
MNSMNLPDKTTPPTVILSGPTRGLGRALFDRLVSQGYHTVGLGRDLGRIAAVASSAPEQVQLVEVDLGADSDVLTTALAAVHRILSTNSSGPLAFISNASIIEPIGRATELTCSGLDRAMRINCLAPLIVANSLTKTAQAQGRPLLVLDVSSGAACRPIRGWQAYCTSKAAYKMGLDVLAAENSHLQVIHFDPGVMDTSMQELIRAQQAADMPEVEVFRAYREEGKLKAPLAVATELIQVIEKHMS